ncbi:hypothetical protein HK099_007737 [Clydaea vesicula]|uniref:Large ribosomal subunit protein bL21m n=1 Tax=Clydaea vesicula TaxID=447962 RepID=A0AAD5XXZ4_9FUNG|nr:hypothetical protein HK099_007737 [Clydaea vesicula]KAJ3383723.1 hypothetical protein HDU92_003954 [Lobulomyces angularis]
MLKLIKGSRLFSNSKSTSSIGDVIKNSIAERSGLNSSTSSIQKTINSKKTENISSGDTFYKLPAAAKDKWMSFSQEDQFYAIIQLKLKPYYIKKNDIIISSKLNDLKPGDKINLEHCSELGSKNFILTGKPLIDRNYFKIEAVVLENFKSDLLIKERRMRRGRNKIVINTNSHTALRISEISVNQKF